MGGKWEPIVKINDNELTGIVQKKEEPKKEYVPKESGPVLELKNDYKDPKFIKKAILVTFLVLVLNLLINGISFISSKSELSFSEFIFIVAQAVTLIITIIGYIGKKESVKITGILASLLMVFTFNIFNVILGVFYFVFSVDQSYYTKLINVLKGLKRKKG